MSSYLNNNNAFFTLQQQNKLSNNAISSNSQIEDLQPVRYSIPALVSEIAINTKKL